MRRLLDIRIGTMVKANAPNPAEYVRQIVGLGFESIEPFFWQTMDKDLRKLAKELREAIGDTDVTIDTLGMFGNPLEDGDLDRCTLAGWEALIDNAHHFGARTIAGFTGRVRGQPIEASLPRNSKRSGANFRAAPPTRACAWRSRTAPWTATGRAATGTSPTIPTPGS